MDTTSALAMGIGTCEPAKEAIALQILLKLQQGVRLEDIDQGQTLATYRRNLHWTLIQPHGSALRKESWKWVIAIADKYPQVFVNVIQVNIMEAQATLDFLRGEHIKSTGKWANLLFEDDSSTMEHVLQEAWSRGKEATDAGNTLLHHCIIVKLMKKLAAAWAIDGEEELRVPMRSL